MSWSTPRSLVLAAALLAVSLLVGPSSAVTPSDVAGALSSLLGLATGPGTPRAEMARAVLLDIRLPRVLLAFLVGSALTLSGASLQAVFRNPLVCPYILGLASGAAFGAALAIATGRVPVQIAAFGFGLAAVGASYLLGRVRRSVSIVSLVLSGVMVSGIFTAGLTLVQVLTDPLRLQTIVYWTMGHLHTAGWNDVRSSALPIVVGSAALLLLGWRMNALALGEEEARSVGLNPEREKLLILIPATLIASASVAVAGVVGLVGLVVPHLVRMLVGPDHRRLLPSALALGGAFLVAVDDLARSLTTYELPIGLFTTLIGAPFFIWLLKRTPLGWEG